MQKLQNDQHRAAMNNADAAVHIGTTPANLRLSRHTGFLYKDIPSPKFLKAGRKVLYLKSDLDNWLHQLPSYQNTAQVLGREN